MVNEDTSSSLPSGHPTEVMAYRRRQQTIPHNTSPSHPTQHLLNDAVDVDLSGSGTNPTSSTSLAATAIRASSASHRDSSLSSAYAGFSTPSSTTPLSSFQNYASNPPGVSTVTEESKGYEYTSMKNLKDGKQGFWSSLARKAKSILDDDDYVPSSPQYADSATSRQQIPQTSTKSKHQTVYPSNEGYRRSERPTIQKGLNAISSSLNYIGNAVEEGLTVVENRTADIIQETRKHIRKKPGTAAVGSQGTYHGSTGQQPQGQGQTQHPAQTDIDLQLKASRDVAMAMAAKAKLLLRELKTVKADLAFAKERCAQLEDENKILRENRGSNDDPEDDDLIRLQLETLLAEKARLAHENSVYARENRFLREVVEYHQLTMQDVVYLDEGTEEVTEVYPIKVVSNPQSTDATFDKSMETTLENPPRPVPPPGAFDFSRSYTQSK